jgi:hypothetical protein
MMNVANLLQKMRTGIWTECTAIATNNDSIMATKSKPVLSHNQIFEKELIYTWHLRTFGQIRIVTNPSTQKIWAKLEDLRKSCMFVGYADYHGSGVYRMLSLTNRILKKQKMPFG